ncbi:MAG: hypothetical protein E6G30_03000 [Actinobacteria bacterium]|nr:MAG: hypothetical protein E6G30_03000 [Actinomycetota bacterium]
MRRLLLTLSLAGLTLALWAPAALAGKPDNGEGLWGETNDKVVTDAGFLLIGAFPLLVLLLSLLQWRLDKRKEARKAAARSRVDWDGGW